MIELSDLPVFAVMAFGAVGAIAAFVTVIFLVAADAGHWRCFDRVFDPVASGTSGRYMRTHELEACVLVVIEIDRFPRRRRMTFGTVRTPRALVRIFFGMTAIACARRLADRIVDAVTAGARRARMLTQQRKARVAAVIECGRFPVCGRMATGAIRTARSSVNVILCVASDARLRQALPLLAGMAGHASRSPVLPGQRKSGFGMVKGKRLFPSENSMAALAVFTQSS